MEKVCHVMGTALALWWMIAEVRAQDFTYTTNSGTITITGSPGNGLEGAVSIPSTINGLPVVGIETLAFLTNFGLTGVTIPNNVTNIGGAVFDHCSALRNVTLSDGLIYIGQGAFQQTALTSITIPNSVTAIDVGAFAVCTALTNVTIGSSVSYMGAEAFIDCSNLASAFFKGNAPSTGQDEFGDTVFQNDSSLTVYYLAGTKGWGATFGGAPTKLWNPQALTNDAAWGVRQNRFGFDIVGTSDIPIVVEACTNLAAQSWVTLQTCTLTNGLVHFGDPQWTNFPGHFYRIRSP